MELKIQRDTKVVLALNEEEAQQLLTLCALTPRGAHELADTLFDELHDAVSFDGDAVIELRRSVLEPTR
jgi:hypothetical protein